MNKVIKDIRKNDGREVWYGNDNVCVIIILDKKRREQALSLD